MTTHDKPSTKPLTELKVAAIPRRGLAGGDQAVLITGAGSSGGIGRATAQRLARDGYHLALLDLNADAVASAAQTISADFDVQTIALAADVSDATAVDRAFTQLEKSGLPPLTGLVNNAGVSAPTSFLESTDDEWDLLFRVNVTGVRRVSRRALPGMIERGRGSIVNLASMAGERGGGIFGGSHYAATKGAVLALGKALARELAGRGIRVNNVAPGYVEGTEITAGRLTPERYAAIMADIPIGQAGRTRDVAGAIAFLLSDDAEYVTGATIDVNGGAHIH